MKIGRAMAYVLAGILFVGYVGILWWARTPDVSEVYRMYYIDHELQEWPGEDGLRVTSDDWEYLRLTTEDTEKRQNVWGKGGLIRKKPGGGQMGTRQKSGIGFRRERGRLLFGFPVRLQPA